MRPVEAWRVDELRKRGAPHGLTPEQVQAVELLEMSLEPYAAYSRVVRDVNDHQQFEHDEEARDQARREIAVERAKAELEATT